MAGPPPQVDVRSLDDYLDVMSKAVFQSGISWQVVDAKWDTTRDAFHQFDVREVANMTPFDVKALTKDTRVIRHRRKLEAVVHNARRMLDLDEEYGSFQDYLRAHGDFDATLKAMKKDFKYLGPTGIYYFLYVVKEAVPAHEEFEARYR